MFPRSLYLPLLLLASSLAQAQVWDERALKLDPATATSAIAPALDGLGEVHRTVTTQSAESQRFFDQGLALVYGFNHSEAIRAFKEAARLDPRNAMAWWGVAFSLGPNLNLPMTPDATAPAWDALQKALALRERASPVEQGLIDALAQRYANPAPESRAALDRAFAEAMRDLAGRFPNDADVLTVFADALMNLSPWNYWNADGSPRGEAELIVDTLERALRKDPDHTGALHLHIHAVEAVDARRAEASADRLLRQAPNAGHLVHMASHVYMNVGRYADAYASNVAANEADNRYVAACKAQGLYPLFYHRHNQHFLTWAAMLQGRRAAAMDAGRLIAPGLTPGMIAGPFSETLQHLMSQPVYVMARFGRWQELLAEPKPTADYTFSTAIWHYGRGLAWRHTGQQGKARRELAELERIARSAMMTDKYVGFAPAPAVLGIAVDILAGEIAAARGDLDAAIARFDRAVRAQDGFLYNEPPDWFFPVRHYLGATLLDAGRAAEAEVVYWQDLRRNPANGYALFGLEQAQRAQGKAAEADATALRLVEAWRDADVKLTSSRY